jgi:hypothetical protein
MHKNSGLLMHVKKYDKSPVDKKRGQGSYFVCPPFSAITAAIRLAILSINVCMVREGVLSYASSTCCCRSTTLLAMAAMLFHA